MSESSWTEMLQNNRLTIVKMIRAIPKERIITNEEIQHPPRSFGSLSKDKQVIMRTNTVSLYTVVVGWLLARCLFCTLERFDVMPGFFRGSKTRWWMLVKEVKSSRSDSDSC